MTVRRWTLVALAALLWIAGAYATRDVDSDRPTSSAVPIAGEEVGTAEHAWADPPRRAAGDVARNASPAAQPRASRAARTRSTLIDVTAYCHTGNRTASGVWPREGMAASNNHRFGTRLRVPGWGVVEVTDRIGWGSDLDLYMDSCAKARQWGRQQLRVEMVR